MADNLFPIYIVSKGRAEYCLTMKCFDRMGMPYRAIVEAQEVDAYAKTIPRDRLLVLDPAYQRDYDPCDGLGDQRTKGSGAARNFAWDHAASLGAEWHWTVDDNIRAFYRMVRQQKIRLGDATGFRCMEDFVQRFDNIGMAGPQYDYFAPRKNENIPAFIANTRIFSCNLIRTALPFRWRGRYNEDADLSLRILKAGWCTVLFNAFLQKKISRSQPIKGGNEELYSVGSLEKSKLLVTLHPDVVSLVFRYHRWHHVIDMSRFRNLRFHLRDGLEIKPGIDEYGMMVKTVDPKTQRSRYTPIQVAS